LIASANAMPSILDFGRFFFHAALKEKVKSTEAETLRRP
jgi:hypothetical protein